MVAKRKRAGALITRRRAICAAVAACFNSSLTLANPTGPQVAVGQASFNSQGPVLNVINSPGTVINWQRFSIGAGETTRFTQQSAQSAVLNRVVLPDPSVILGTLSSNGKVFLINPAGILVGAGGRVDVAGFVASTLNLTNEDFAAGRLRFQPVPNAGSVVNEGTITSPSGGQVYLIAPAVTNSGVINTPRGETLLAAGNQVELIDTSTPGVTVQIDVPGGEAKNLGQIVADSGRIGIVGALVQNRGRVSADQVVGDGTGRIFLKASKNVTLAAGSQTTANGERGGRIEITADNAATIEKGALVQANGTKVGGNISVSAGAGDAVIAGSVQANGGAQGGTIGMNAAQGAVRLDGELVAKAAGGAGGNVAIAAASTAALNAGSVIAASGKSAGGTVTVTSGANVTVDAQSTVRANGDTGGAVTVTSDRGAINIAGTIEASGAADAGGNVRLTAATDVMVGEGAIVRASGARGGTVYLEARQDHNPTGMTSVAGLIDVFGHEGEGGKAFVLAPHVAIIRNGAIHASGRRGGGIALVGGDYQGRNAQVPNATATYVGAEASIAADAIEEGNGGQVIVWSNEATRVYGAISARGGAQAGNGGFVETSGHYLDVNGIRVSTSAPSGQTGMWLLDPTDLQITSSPYDMYVTSTTPFSPLSTPASLGWLTIYNALGATAVTVTTVGTPNMGQNGDITISNGYSYSRSNALTFNAAGSIVVNGAVANSGSGAITLTAVNAVTLNADVSSVGGVTVNATSASYPAGGNLSSGTLTLNAPTTIYGTFNWSGGTITGSGTLTTSGTTNVTAAVYLKDKTWDNTGTIAISGGTGNYIHLDGSGVTPTILNNKSGGIVSLTDNTSVSYPVGYSTTLTNKTFNNQGTFNKSSSAVTVQIIDVPFNNTGTVSINNGTLKLTRDGTDTGTYSIGGSSTLEISGGTRNFNGTIAISGNGTLLLSGGTLNLGAAITQAATADETWTITGGTLNDTGGLTLNGPFNWTGGTVTGTGTLTTGSTATTTIDTNTVYLKDKTWNNTGTVNISGTGQLYLDGSGATATAFNNNSGGSVVDTTSGSYPIGYSNTLTSKTFNNAGMFSKNTGSQATQYIDVAFNNSGMLDVYSGTLKLPRDGTDAGSYYISTGNTLEIYNGTRNFSTGTALSGMGTLRLSSGTLNLNTAITQGATEDVTWSITGGTLNDAVGLTLNGTFNWSGGMVTGAGTLTTGSTATTTVNTNTVYLKEKIWNNTGTVNISGTGQLYLDGSGTPATTFNNNSGGSVIDTTTGSYPIGYSNTLTNKTFNNAGVFSKNTGSQATQYIDVAFNNTNTVNVNSGTLKLPRNGADTGTYSIGSGNTLEIYNGTRAFNTGTAISGTGTLLLSGGTLNLNAALTQAATGDETWSITGGTLNDAGGLTLNGTFNWSGGTVAGTGTLTSGSTATTNINGSTVYLQDKTWNNNGQVNIGGSGGQLYMKSSTGSIPAVFNNYGTVTETSGGTYPISYPGGYGTNTSWNNYGTFYKNSGSLSTQYTDLTFNNSGTVAVNSGTLRLTANGTDTGTYSIASGKTLEIYSGTRNFDSEIALSGTGTLLVSGGTLNVNTAFTQASGTPLWQMSGGTLSANAALAFGDTLTVTGGTLQGSGNVSVSGAFNWSGGTIQGTGNFNTSGTTTLNPSGSVTLDGTRVWNNSGTVNHSGGGYLYVPYGGAPAVNNLSGATWNENSSNTYYVMYSGTFNNAGTFNKGGTSTAELYNTAFSNTATGAGNAVNVTGGTLQLNGSGTDSGAYAVSSGATLEFNGGTRNLSSGTNISGAGNLVFSGATVNANSGAVISALNNVTLTGGTLSQNTGSTFSPVNLTITGGTLQGTGDVSVSGAFNWSGGTIQGSGNINTSGTTTLNPSSYVTLGGTRVWNNSATVNHTGSSYLYMSYGGTPVVNNLSGATWNENSSNTYYVMYSGTFNNAGTFNKGGTSTAELYDTAFSNTATGTGNAVNVTGGTLQLNGSGTDSGAYAVSSGATLEFNGGTRNLNSGTNISGAGNLVFSGATVNANSGAVISALNNVTLTSGTLNQNTGSTFSPVNLTITGGTLQGSGDVSVSGTFNWSGGTIQGSGNLNTFGTTTLNSSYYGTTLAGARAWNNSGTVDHTGSGYLYMSSGGTPIITNLSGATWNESSTNDYPIEYGIFSNAGIFNKIGTNTAQLSSTAFTNTAAGGTNAVNVNAGTLQLYAASGGSTDTGKYVVASGATLEFGGGTRNLNSGASISGTGTLKFSGGTVNLNVPVTFPTVTLSGGTLGGTGGLTTSNLTWSAGTLLGNLTLAAGGTGTLTGSKCIGNGTTAGLFINKGTVTDASPGYYYDFYMQGGAGSSSSIIDNQGTYTYSTTGTPYYYYGIYSYGANTAMSNSGTFTVNSSLPMGGTKFTNASAGTVNVNADSLSTGAFMNSGTINVAANGRLMVSGNLTLSPTSTVNSTINGLSVGSFGRISATGVADLQGSLHFTKGSGYTPAISDTVQVITYGSRTANTFTRVAPFFASTFTAAYGTTAFSAQVTALTGGINAWLASGDGQWTTATNWSFGHIPLSDEDVEIATAVGTAALTSGTQAIHSLVSNSDLNVSGGTLDLASTSSVNGRLTLSAGTLEGAGNLTVKNFNMSGGTVSGPGTLTINNVFSRSGGSIGGTLGGLYVTQGSGDLAPGTLNVNGPVSLVANAGALALDSISATTISARAAGGNVTLNSGAALAASGTNDALVLAAASNFVNNAGASALSTPNGRWLVYSTDPAVDVRGGLAYGFKHYGLTYSSTPYAGPGTGNGFIYGLLPGITPSLTGAVTKVYDATTTAVLTPGNYATRGAIDGDTIAYTSLTTPTYADKNTGSAKVISATVGLAGASNGSAQVFGYQLSGGTISAPIGKITPAPLAVSGVTVNNKVYDATPLATLNTGTANVTPLAGDVVAVSVAGATATFVDKNAGVGKPVTATGFTLSGADAANYTLAQPSALAADITPASVTVSGISANNKVYDASTTATLNASAATLGGVFTGDSVVLVSGAAAFADKNAGVAKPVSTAGFGLSGADAGNYTVVQPAGLAADITRAMLTVSGLSAADKVYDGTTLAALSGGGLSGVLGSDVVSVSGSGAFADRNVGVAKPVMISSVMLSGADAGNYTVTKPGVTLAADITAKPVATWVGSGGGLWSSSANWDHGVVPEGANVLAVSIPGSASAVVTYDASAGSTTLKTLQSGESVVVKGGSLTLGTAAGDASKIDSGARLELQSGAAVTLVGDLAAANYVQSAGALTGSGNLAVGTSFSQSGGSIALTGTAGVAITQAAGNLAIGSISAASVALNAQSGAITQSAPLVAAAVATQSVAGTGLTDSGNRIGRFSAVNNGGGDIALVNTGALVIGGITNSGGNVSVENTGAVSTVGAVSAPSGAVSITTHSPLTIGAGGASAARDIALKAGESGQGGDDLTLGGTVASTAGSGAIALVAGDNVYQNAQVTNNGGSVSALAQHGSVKMLPMPGTTSSNGGRISYEATAGDVVLTSLDAGSGAIDLKAGGSSWVASGFSGANLIGGSAAITIGGDAAFSTRVQKIDANVNGAFAITDVATGTVMTNASVSGSPAGLNAPLQQTQQSVVAAVNTSVLSPTTNTGTTTGTTGGSAAADAAAAAAGGGLLGGGATGTGTLVTRTDANGTIGGGANEFGGTSTASASRKGGSAKSEGGSKEGGKDKGAGEGSHATKKAAVCR